MWQDELGPLMQWRTFFLYQPSEQPLFGKCQWVPLRQLQSRLLVVR